MVTVSICCKYCGEKERVVKMEKTAPVVHAVYAGPADALFKHPTSTKPTK